MEVRNYSYHHDSWSKNQIGETSICSKFSDSELSTFVGSEVQDPYLTIGSNFDLIPIPEEKSLFDISNPNLQVPAN